MYPKFIEVHAKSDNPLEDVVTIVNVAHIMYFHGNVICTPKGFFSVSETFDELKALITDCGCYINKGDPRLDTENRLTEQMIMDEGMVGEPVWNTNKGRWYIIANWSNLKDDFLMELQGIYDILRYTAEDLKKFPLYRMKR